MVKRGKARLFWEGNPIVYGGAVDHVDSGSDLSPGDPVLLADHTSRAFGWGVYNPNSMYRVRWVSPPPTLPSRQSPPLLRVFQPPYLRPFHQPAYLVSVPSCLMHALVDLRCPFPFSTGIFTRASRLPLPDYYRRRCHYHCRRRRRRHYYRLFVVVVIIIVVVVIFIFITTTIQLPSPSSGGQGVSGGHVMTRVQV